MPSHSRLAIPWLLSGVALGEVLTTIVPCPSMSLSSTLAPITVTEQHQPVSTCKPDGTTISWSTYDYVSTVIPCWGGSSYTSCTVTDTAQNVPCYGLASTVTSVVPITTTMRKHHTMVTGTSYSTSYETMSKQWDAAYDQIGPFAIPGYDGCELCTECGIQDDGSRKQAMNVTECTSAAGKHPSCSQFTEEWVSQPVPSATGVVMATPSSKFEAPTAGVYTFTFPQPAPSTTIESEGQVYTVAAEPWNAYVTKTCSGHTTFDFMVTVTKTVTFHDSHSTGSDSHETSAPGGSDKQGWANWDPATTTAESDPSSSTPWGHHMPSSVNSQYSEEDSPQWNGWSESLKSSYTNVVYPTSTGEYEHMTATGEYEHTMATGGYEHTTATGEYEHTMATGGYEHTTATGEYEHTMATGGNYYTDTTTQIVGGISTGTYSTYIASSTEGTSSTSSSTTQRDMTSAGAVTTIAGEVTTIAGAVTTVAGPVITITGEVTTITGAITTVTGEVTTIPGVVTTIAGEVTTIPGAVTTIAGEVTTITGAITTITGAITTIPGVVTTIAGEVTTIPGVITTIAGEVTTIPGVITTIAGEVTTIAGVVTTVTGAVTTITAEVTPITGGLTTIADEVTTSTMTPVTTITTSTPQPSTFYIQATINGLRKRYVKRADNTYVGFPDGSDDASLVTSTGNPSLFYFDSEGYLETGLFFILGGLSSGFSVFERSLAKPAQVPAFTLGADGTVTLAGAGFCATSTNLFITVGNAPSDCRPVTLTAVPVLDAVITTTTSTSLSTTTSATTVTSTVTSTVTATTTADVSGGLDAPDPTPTAGTVKRGLRYGRRNLN